jgi:hypothetical protein
VDGRAAGAGGAGVAAAWPPPVLLPLAWKTDQTFPAERVRVLSGAPRDAAAIRDRVERARRDFAAFVAEHGVARPLATPALTVVIVPASTMCDARIYERGVAPAGCESRAYWYRPREKTLYLADGDAALDANLPFGVAAGICLHSDVSGCDELAVQFGEAAP